MVTLGADPRRTGGCLMGTGTKSQISLSNIDAINIRTYVLGLPREMT